MKNETKPLIDKVNDWINKEGYPLEFETAKTFRTYNFRTFQGHYVEDLNSKSRREIDVIGDYTIRIDNSTFRISHLVECKWSKDKPWIIFTDPSSSITTGACIAQSVYSELMDCMMWYLNGDSEIQNLDMFKSHLCPGFNGVQAFSKQNDLVYSALQSVMSASYAEMKKYDRGFKTAQDFLNFGVYIRPLIVIDGNLFESYYNYDLGKTELRERKKIRLYWRGSEAWNYHSTIDIVTKSELNAYVSSLALESKQLLEKVKDIYPLIKKAIMNKDLTALEEINRTASTGRISYPKLLRRIVK